MQNDAGEVVDLYLPRKWYVRRLVQRGGWFGCDRGARAGGALACAAVAPSWRARGTGGGSCMGGRCRRARDGRQVSARACARAARRQEPVRAAVATFHVRGRGQARRHGLSASDRLSWSVGGW
jgi:hypothetical protein